MEGLPQRFHHFRHVGVVDGIVQGEADDQKSDHGQDNGRTRGDGHVADVGEQIGTRHRRCQVGGVGEGRHLVAEVCARDDGSGHQTVVDAQGAADAHQGDTDGGDGRPGAARGQRHQRRDSDGGKEEDLGVEDLQTVIDQQGHHAAEHPCAGEGADEEKDEDGRHGRGDTADDAGLHLFPAYPGGVGYHTGDGRRQDERHLVGPAQRILKKADIQEKKKDQEEQRQ